jgi:hypothetical protein
MVELGVAVQAEIHPKFHIRALDTCVDDTLAGLVEDGEGWEYLCIDTLDLVDAVLD